MVEKRNINEPMPSKGVRLRTDQWEMCDRMYEKLGLESRNDFIRDAVDFYIEWLERDKAEKFITPALESVIDGKLKDTEERLARILFKLAVGQNMSAHLLCSQFELDDREVEDLRQSCVRELKMTNGTIDTVSIMRKS